MAVEWRNLEALEMLLEAGADPDLKTRIDDYETPRDLAAAAGLPKFVALLRREEKR